MIDLTALQSLFGSEMDFGANWVRYITAFALILACLFAKKTFDLYLSKFFLRLAQRTRFQYGEAAIKALNPPISAAFLVLGLFLALNVLRLPLEPVDVRSIVLEAFRVAMAVVVVWAAFRLTDVFAMFLSDRLADKDEVYRLQFVPLIKKSLRIFVVIVGSLLIIQNLGYSVGSLLAGLGIGGLAIALAAQESLANFFGSVVLLTDRPFKVGDWIQVDKVDGFVEELGFRSTRVRTWSRSLVTIPNKTLANSVIENWSKMPNRRVRQVLRITYGASVEQVQTYVNGLRELVANHPGVDQGFHLVSFTDFGENGFEILVYYFTVSVKWAEHLALKQEMNLNFMHLAQKVGVSFALPSRSVYLDSERNPHAQY